MISIWRAVSSWMTGMRVPSGSATSRGWPVRRRVHHLVDAEARALCKFVIICRIREGQRQDAEVDQVGAVNAREGFAR